MNFFKHKRKLAPENQEEFDAMEEAILGPATSELLKEFSLSAKTVSERLKDLSGRAASFMDIGRGAFTGSADTNREKIKDLNSGRARWYAENFKAEKDITEEAQVIKPKLLEK